MLAYINWPAILQSGGAVFTIVAVVGGTLGWLYRRLIKQIRGDIIEIKQSVNANGLDTDSAGDSSKRTEEKVDLLMQDMNDIKKTLSGHELILKLLVNGERNNRHPY